MYARTLELGRNSVDEKTGEFEATLFTSGEASDGHILDMAGARLPEAMPLFVNHQADPIGQLGTLFPRSQGGAVVVRGQIETGGTGAHADIRRDLLVKMAGGHLRAMSGRWDADESATVRRSDLPRDHPAAIGKNATPVQRGGMLFREWSAVEGSIVGLGADPAATMRWAREAEGPVAEFWSGQAQERQLAAFRAYVRELVSDGADPQVLGWQMHNLGITVREQGEEEIDEAVRILRSLEAGQNEIHDILSALGERTQREDPKPEPERNKAAPLPAPEAIAEQIARGIEQSLERSEARWASVVDKAIGDATGKVQ